jgi:hypothetical protein
MTGSPGVGLPGRDPALDTDTTTSPERTKENPEPLHRRLFLGANSVHRAASASRPSAASRAASGRALTPPP